MDFHGRGPNISLAGPEVDTLAALVTPITLACLGSVKATGAEVDMKFDES